MKNKSAHHKDLNTFKFLPFAERIANIDVDIFHRVGHEYETQCDEEGCNFYQAVQKWNFLNLTEGYDDFKREIKAHTLVTLPQLIVEKDAVVEVLLKHLRLKNPLYLQPILDILVALVKDLRKDFYPYYQQFLAVLIELLNTKDTEQLEWTFTCLAYLFKYLWRPFIRDISSVFNSLVPLLSSSRPEYVNSFAAGSFAFVARKVKDRRAFLLHILKTVKSQKDGVDGCGKLLFEAIHGVTGQFHSCAESTLNFLLQSLSDAKLPQSILFEIVEQIVNNIALNIQPKNCNLLFDVLIKTIEQLIANSNNLQDEDVEKNVQLILKLLGQSIEYKSGKLLQNPVAVVNLIGDILINENLSNDLMLTITQIGILLLLSKNIKLTQEDASKIVQNVLNIPEKSVLLYFVDNIGEFSSFDALILPKFLNYCFVHNLEVEFLHVLTKLIMKKSPNLESGISLTNWKRYAIDFHGIENNLKIEQVLLSHINNFQIENFDNYVCSLICLPHLNLVNVDEVSTVLIKNVDDLIKNINSDADQSQLKTELFLLNYTIECLIHLAKSEDVIDKFQLMMDCLLPLAKNADYICSLKMIDLLITAFRENEDIINMKNFEKINAVLCDNLNSPYHEVRLITAHLYTYFEKLQEFVLEHSPDSDVPMEEFRVFSLFYKVESIEPHVHTYRDQLQHLDKLCFDKPQMIMCNQTQFKTLPLRYLCGTLYINFKLIWEPVSKIIETHAHGLNSNDFWSIFGQEIRNVVENVRQPKIHNIDLIATNCEFLSDLYQNSQKLVARPHFSNYRVLLWKTMSLFPDVGEAKTRDISELLLDFISCEFVRNNGDIAQTWNIKQNSLEHGHPVNEDVETENVGKNLQSAKIGGEKANIKTLLSYLSVFRKIQSPESMYRESDLYKLYFELLQNKNSEIQKTALDCIMTYKRKYLIPYKTNLYNLVDEKNFKNELSTLKIDKDSAIVLDEHRDNLIPIIMRIVFSKMNAKTGLRTGGKASGQLRRNLVLRFLAGCQENEMLSFIHMTFKFYNKYLDDDWEVMADKLCDGADLEKFIPPKRLQSSINMLNVILHQFGGLMGDEVLTFLLKIIVIVGATIKGAFIRILNVHSGYFSILKNLRSSCIKLVERFFSQFFRYNWNSQQINAIFSVFVWPYLDRLNIDGIHSPTSLLKLFVQWGSNPRYFPLLVKHQANDQKQFVFPHVMKLLLNEKSHFSVVALIQEMIEKLLSLQPDEEDQQLLIPIDNLLPIDQKILDQKQLTDKLNYGSCILLPFVPEILRKIKMKLENQSKNLLNQRELLILSRISELVWESEMSNSVLKLLLPIVYKRCCITIAEDVVIRYLITISNLLGNVSAPDVHLKQLTPLFGEICYPSGRKLLSKILRVIGEKSGGNLLIVSQLIDELNAWDAKWLDQPDFQRRHDAFKTIHTQIDTDSIGLDGGILFIYNCHFLMRNEKDLSMRENSTYCLKQLIPHLLETFKHNQRDVDLILNDTVLTLIRNGMKSRNDDYRNECISLLGHLARECPDRSVVLRDLNRYTNKTDLEVDFFENITHLQMHRHARGLLRFCQITKEQTTTINSRTLTQFILPLGSFYLCSERYIGKNSVIDAAIECIGTVCRILPWHQYEGVLKYYLSRLRSKLDYQKQLVRLLVVILDAFHFDLSKARIVLEVNKSLPEQQGQLPELPCTGSSVVEDDDESAAIDAANLDVDEVVDDLIPDEGGDEHDEDGAVGEEVKICDKITIPCKSTALRITNTIRNVLLPQLHKALAEMTQYDVSHKINRRRTGIDREEEDLLRVPISLALVKLLQRLPNEILEANLPGIFIKLCTFLKSHLESVRRVTRETLQKIMQTLGPDYLHLLLEQMTPLLSRGFHVHVLVFTTHAVLCCLKESYRPNDLDKILLTVLNLCKADLFGNLSDEREIAKIATKTTEAKQTKSFDTFQILAQYITDHCLMDLILPIKDVLQSTHSFKTVHKAEECLRHIALGLADNHFISVESLLKFAYGIASESIPEFVGLTSKSVTPAKDKLKRERPDCFIIPKAPVGRSGIRVNNVKSSSQTNAHLLIEFGIRLCVVLLKRDKVKGDDYKPFMDPFVGIFKKCLNTKHVKLSTLTLQCLCWIMKYDLPSLRENIGEIVKDMFDILHKYAAAGLSKGDNFDLVVAAFKAMSVLVRDVNYHTIDTDQLKILLLFAEQDMHDHDRQATAFNLLKAIITRKLIVPEIHEIMAKVAELSITSELNYVRSQSRIVFHQYLMEYPLGNKFESHLSFYISQMSYELQYGRESALEMIETLIRTFPRKTLKENSGTLLITLGARLVNDEVPECRKTVANCLLAMLGRLTKADRQPLFDIVVQWLKDRNVSHRQLAAQLCGIFVSVEKSTFEKRLSKLLPLITRQFGSDDKSNEKPPNNNDDDDDDNEENQRLKDHHFFQVLQLLLKICNHCPGFLKMKEINDLASHVQLLLAHPHDWVRLAAAQFLGFVLSVLDIDQMASLVASNTAGEMGHYLHTDPLNNIKSLTLDLCDQLQPGIKSELAQQVVKNLVFIARVLQNVPNNDERSAKINLLWLTKRMRKIVNNEVVEAPSQIVLRMEIFKWIAGVGTVLKVDNIVAVLNHLLAPLVREMITTEESNAPLRQLSKEVAGLLKTRIGMEAYTKTLLKLQQNLSVRRAERKRARTQLAVTDPETHAKKKIKRHEKKKELKKRKLSARKGKKVFKRRKVVDLDPESEVM